MQDLLQTIQDHDIGFLRAMAELWGLDPPPAPASEAAQALATAILESSTMAEGISTLPAPLPEILEDLAAAGGRLAWPDLERRYGPVRSLGPGRRDREKPWRNPVSPLESLWYRGLVGRAFADTPVGFEEFGFVPDEVLAYLKTDSKSDESPFGHPADEPDEVQLSTSRMVDDAVTLLAALRRRPAEGVLPEDRRRRLSGFLLQPGSLDLIVELLFDTEILGDTPLEPRPDQARGFLDQTRSEALAQLGQTWVISQTWNDLAHVPGLLHATLPWPNEPAGARQAVLGMLQALPGRSWWDIAAFVADVKTHRPGFQRPGGDFDAWYMQDSRSGRFLRGYENWDAVDGRLLAYIISGPLHWLGAVDLGGGHPAEGPTAMRLTPWFERLIGAKARPSIESGEGQASITMDGKVKIPRSVDASLRYQIARVCTWIGLDGDLFTYQLTARSLESARRQGLTVGHIRTLLARLTDGELPARLDQALRRYEANGPDASLSHKLLFTISQPEALARLRRERRATRFLEHPVGEHSFLIDHADLQPLLRLSLKLGVWIQPGGPSMDDSP